MTWEKEKREWKITERFVSFVTVLFGGAEIMYYGYWLARARFFYFEIYINLASEETWKYGHVFIWNVGQICEVTKILTADMCCS